MQYRSFLHSAVSEWARNLVGETHLFSQTFNQPYRSLFTPHATSGQVLAVGVVCLPSTGCGAEFGPSTRIQSASMQSRVGQAEQEHRPTPALPRKCTREAFHCRLPSLARCVWSASTDTGEINDAALPRLPRLEIVLTP
jgi:hypothetical protein